ncbi:hypothetical protein AFLA_000558 [Aspergillus flavus NRRL3357]|nr:hypothetical protein AFLA_000558 [Aspergillus flavus NRRL3357]
MYTDERIGYTVFHERGEEHYFSFHPFFFSVFILLLPLPFLFLYSTTLLWRGSSYYTHLSKHPSHTTVINSFWTKPSLSS